MGRRQNPLLLMLRSERQGQKSGERVIKGDLYHSFYWVIIYSVIMKRIVARVHFPVLVLWGYFGVKAWNEQGCKMNEYIKRVARQRWSDSSSGHHQLFLGQGIALSLGVLCLVQREQLLHVRDKSFVLNLEGLILLLPLLLAKWTLLEAKALSEQWIYCWMTVQLLIL